MGIRIDHVALPSRDPVAEADWLGALLGLAVEADGPEGELRCLRLDHGGSLVLGPATEIAPVHLALHVPPRELSLVISRLESRHVPFGNDPEDPTNGRHDDPLGGVGRIYFVSSDGHLLEVCA